MKRGNQYLVRCKMLNELEIPAQELGRMIWEFGGPTKKFFRALKSHSRERGFVYPNKGGGTVMVCFFEERNGVRTFVQQLWSQMEKTNDKSPESPKLPVC